MELIDELAKYGNYKLAYFQFSSLELHTYGKDYGSHRITLKSVENRLTIALYNKAYYLKSDKVCMKREYLVIFIQEFCIESVRGAINLITIKKAMYSFLFFSLDKCQFFAQQIYSLSKGSFPRSVAVADLNGDGKKDIIATDSIADNVTIIFNLGYGNFSVQLEPPADYGASPYSVAAQDINGDGRVDILVANYDSDKIGVLINQGNGTYANQIIYSMDTGTSTHCIKAIDVNGDAIPDIVIANSGSDNVGVFINRGNGEFKALITFSMGIGSSPYSVTTDDINNDNKIDIISANYGSNTIGVLENKGDGTFFDHVTYSTGIGSTPYSVATSDINKDGQIDVIVANYGSDTIGVFLNKGDGTFFNQMTYSTGSGSAPTSVTTGDVDRDGNIDIIVANSAADNVGVLLNSGNGVFLQQTQHSTGAGSSPFSIETADLNGDQKLDIVVANFGSDSIGVFMGC